MTTVSIVFPSRSLKRYLAVWPRSATRLRCGVTQLDRVRKQLEHDRSSEQRQTDQGDVEPEIRSGKDRQEEAGDDNDRTGLRTQVRGRNQVGPPAHREIPLPVLLGVANLVRDHRL